MSGWKLFEAIGIELEYMIVARDSLDVYPVADRVLETAGGTPSAEVESGALAWSNELVLHVIELKTNGPVASLDGTDHLFDAHIDRINAILAAMDGRLMPSAAHPWMDPLRETRLWPHECGPIYEAYHKIFDCRGHGWSNLQSAHINLPFSGDDEFGRLHAAIRVLLPIMPALTASSPIIDGAAAAHLDGRMQFYSTNSRRIPEVAGAIIPEPAFTEAAYRRQIFEPMYAAIAPFDPEGILAHEFLNSRGAIARFDRGAIEIRVLDVQETPAADLAVARLIIAALTALSAQTDRQRAKLMAWEVAPLARILKDVIRLGEQAMITEPAYLELFGCGPKPLSAAELWRRIARDLADTAGWNPSQREALAVILSEGPLARRILAAVDGDFRRDRLSQVYRRLCDCLARHRMFLPASSPT